MVEPEVSLQADGLFSVSVRVDVEALNGNATIAKDSKCPDKRCVPGIKASAALVLSASFRTRKQKCDLSNGSPRPEPDPREDDLHQR